MIAAGGSLAAIVILVICLIGLLAISILGIFLSSEKTSYRGSRWFIKIKKHIRKN